MTNNSDQDYRTLKEQPFVTHLIELRDRVMRAFIAVLVIFVCLFPWANDLYQMVSKPLLEVLPEGQNMIATGVISPFLAPFKLALVTAIFLAMPVILYQLWAFIAPGLYKHEKRVLMPMVGSSALLFYLGAFFAYKIVFPLIFEFMKMTTPEGVDMIPDITQYLELVLTLFFAFGLAFEVPIATIIIVWMGLTTPDKLTQKRPYVVVGAFCMGMFLTPPDVISQTLLAIPMLLLFEVGIIFSRIIVRNKEEREKCESESETHPDEPNPGGEAAAVDAGDQDSEGEAEPKPERKPRRQPRTAGIAAAEMVEIQNEGSEPEDEEETITGPADDMLSLDGDRMFEKDRFTPLTEEELDAELGNDDVEPGEAEEVDKDV
ncbi:MAG: twin-arginine translocase subunit TatC [Gammaproteobacteria bacterium]|nr:twin-arginine translocase subunit TatC [Gammaproteobacteria bacterium]